MADGRRISLFGAPRRSAAAGCVLGRHHLSFALNLTGEREYPRPPPIQVSTHRTEGLVSSARWDKPVEINFHRFFLLAITNDERSRIAQFLSYRAGRTPGGHSLEAGNERCAAHGGIGLSS